jgi:methionine-rich copper-binding protein CopC
MIRTFVWSGRISALILVFALLVLGASKVSAHARFERTEPPNDAPLDGTPIVLKVFFSQELTSTSKIRVLDANGAQVDLGDGRVDLDDPIRKTMLVSLPELPVGVYTIDFTADSAEDGHEYPGTAQFGVGMLPPAAGQPSETPAAEPTTDTEAGPSGTSPDAARPIAY